MATVEGINKIAVIGAGMMGFGIGVDFARAGYQVWLYNTREETSRLAMQKARTALDHMVEGELITPAEADAAYARLHPTINMEEAARGADYISESVAEGLALKREVFGVLDKLCPPPTIITTNSSSFMTTSIVSNNVEHPERCCVAHYFQPPHLLPLVEIVGGEQTTKETTDRTYEILSKMGKKPVIIPVEVPSHAGNRLQGAMSEAIRYLIDNGICTPKMVDTIIMYSFGRRLANTGSFIRSDLVGFEFPYYAAQARGVEPWWPLKQMYERGDRGMISGRGYYEWPDFGVAMNHKQDMELIRFLKRDMMEGDTTIPEPSRIPIEKPPA